MQNYKKEWEDDFYLKHGICYSTHMRNQNREKFRAYRREQLPCECGKTVRRDHLKKHQLTKTHIDILAEILNTEVAESTPKV